MQPTESQTKELLRGPDGVIIPGAAWSWRFSGILNEKPELSEKFAAWAGCLPKNIVALPDFGEYTPVFLHHFGDFLLKDEVQWQYADIRAILACALHRAGFATIQQVEEFFVEHGRRISQNTKARRYALFQLLMERHPEEKGETIYFSGGLPEDPEVLHRWKADLSSRDFPQSVLTSKATA